MQTVETMENKKKSSVPLREKLSYALGDASSSLVRIMISMYLMYFYTDVFKISAAAVGTLFLVARIFDSFGDPFIGILVDKTKTKYGRFRPWILGDAIPLGGFAILCFMTPNLSPVFKLGYAYITYIGLSVASTCIHLPLTAILPSLTDDPHERTVLNVFRMTGGQVAGLVASAITVPMVMYFGNGVETKGYFGTIIIYGLFSIAALVFCFFNMKERVKPKKDEILSVKESILSLKGNWPWFLLLLTNFMNNIVFSSRMSGLIYYTKYNLNNMGIMPIISILSYASLLSILALPILTKKISKRNAMILGYGIQIFGLLILQFFPSIIAVYIGTFITSFGFGFGTGLLYAMFADTVDYGEWKTGLRSQGFLSAAGSFGEKMGSSISGALCGFILTAGNYVADANVEPNSALIAIKAMYITVPCIAAAIAIIILSFYKLDSIYPTIRKELDERNSAN